MDARPARPTAAETRRREADERRQARHDQAARPSQAGVALRRIALQGNRAVSVKSADIQPEHQAVGDEEAAVGGQVEIRIGDFYGFLFVFPEAEGQLVGKDAVKTADQVGGTAQHIRALFGLGAHGGNKRGARQYDGH